MNNELKEIMLIFKFFLSTELKDSVFYIFMLQKNLLYIELKRSDKWVNVKNKLFL